MIRQFYIWPAALIGAVAIFVGVTGNSIAADAPATTPPVQAQTVAADPQDEIVCERVKITGSRIGREKICMTRAEWASVKESAQRTTEGITDKASAINPPESPSVGQ